MGTADLQGKAESGAASGLSGQPGRSRVAVDITAASGRHAPRRPPTPGRPPPTNGLGLWRRPLMPAVDWRGGSPVDPFTVPKPGGELDTGSHTELGVNVGEMELHCFDTDE